MSMRSGKGHLPCRQKLPGGSWSGRKKPALITAILLFILLNIGVKVNINKTGRDIQKYSSHIFEYPYFY
jgi:hypothetical protein